MEMLKTSNSNYRTDYFCSGMWSPLTRANFQIFCFFFFRTRPVSPNEKLEIQENLFYFAFLLMQTNSVFHFPEDKLVLFCIPLNANQFLECWLFLLKLSMFCATLLMQNQFSKSTIFSYFFLKKDKWCISEAPCRTNFFNLCKYNHYS